MKISKNSEAPHWIILICFLLAAFILYSCNQASEITGYTTHDAYFTNSSSFSGVYDKNGVPICLGDTVRDKYGFGHIIMCKDSVMAVEFEFGRPMTIDGKRFEVVSGFKVKND